MSEKPQPASRSEVLAFLQTGAPLKEKSKVKSAWNKAHPTEPITTQDWDFNAEKRALAPQKPPPTMPITSTAPLSITITTSVIPTPLPPPLPSFPLMTPTQPPQVPHEAMVWEAPEKKTLPGKEKKKKSKAEKYKKGSTYNGSIGPIGLDHLPASDPRAQRRAETKHHGRRAKTMTVFTDDGYALAQAVIREHRSGRDKLVVVTTTPGGDVIVMHPTSGLKLGIHASQRDAKVYPTSDNKEKYIEKA